MNFPEWMSDLFIRFSAIYGGLWTYDLNDEAKLLTRKIEWFLPLSCFSREVIHRAIDTCKLTYDRPPTIKQFHDVCNSILRNHPEFNNKKPQQEFTRQPCSALLAAYMIDNPNSQMVRENVMGYVQTLLANTQTQIAINAKRKGAR